MIAGSIFLVATRADVAAVRAPAGLAALARGDLPAQQPACSSRCASSIFWGTFFPLIAEAVTGRQRNIGPPVYERFVVPLALILVLLTGIGPVIAWRRATAANLRAQPRRARRWPALVVLVALIALGVTELVHRADDVHARRRSWSAAIVQELWRGVRARRAVAREPVPRRARLARQAQPAPLRRLLRARRDHHAVRRRGRVLDRSRTSRTSRCSPGQTAQVGGYEFTYVKPIAELHAAPNGRLERIAFGAAAAASRAAARPSRCARRRTTSRRRTRRSGPVSRFFDGESTTEVGARREPAQGRLGRGRAGHREAPAADRRGRPALRPRPPTT